MLPSDGIIQSVKEKYTSWSLIKKGNILFGVLKRQV